MKKAAIILVMILAAMLASQVALGENKKEYQNKFRLMLDYAVRTNEYVRRHLGDKSLVAYAQTMAEKNATQAERMTPPKKYTMIHPHFLLVLENIERSFFFAEKGDLANYRRHQKIVRRELHLLEALAEREHLDLYMWEKGR
ncbi:MAG: hypothetical protein GY854_25700 [Deltaproteobacteria bacterium]|nr:hypothetical protein [Deltaproteobacteria bacterium]